ncbi:MAG TPA: response regulator transcription factor [Candidatus Saccharimonadales bacterium]|nr:response regulator transcription factor [Candidatus Saccharimonadales bacterium]
MKVGAYSKVLLVDDDSQLTEVLSIKLRHAGYLADTACNGEEGFRMASRNPYDAIVLDITMPERSGLEVCKDLRRQGVLTPILILSGKSEEPSVVQGLDLGADDYLAKPFSQNELVARLSALVRRHNKSFAVHWAHKYGIGLNLDTYTVHVGAKSVKLTKKEALLLQRLMHESPSPTSRAVLLQDVWGIDDLHTSNRLDVYIRRLRWKLEQLTHQNLIHTVRGQGYYFSQQADDTVSDQI